MQEAEEYTTEILNTRGVEGITGSSKNNYVTQDCTKMLSNGGSAEIFPTVCEMKGK